MKVFIKPLEKLVEVTRMPYIECHILGNGFTPGHYQVEAVDGQIYEVPTLQDLILVYDSQDELIRERDQKEAYEAKAAAYFDSYTKFRKELKMTPDEFMKAVPFEKF